MLSIDLPLAIALLAALIAGIVRGFSGFGSGMIMVAALSALYGPVIALPVVLMTELLISLPLIPASWRHADWQKIWRIGLMGAITAPLGVYILQMIPAATAKIMISTIILAFVMLMLIQKSSTLKHPRSSIWGAGILSGLCGGISGMTGPPVVMMLLRTGLEASVVRATLICYFVLIDAWVVASFALQTEISHSHFSLTGYTIVPMIFGAIVGSRLFPLASEKTFRKIALAVVGSVALASPWV